jgi:phosphoribosylamine--glycine ligase
VRVCVVGSGAREHAIARACAGSAEVVVAPGNPGMRWLAAREDSSEARRISTSDAPVEEIEADLVVIGPEAPLVEGLADRLRGLGRLVVGPGADGARLEGSKAWMKELLGEARVPTARHGTFDHPDEAIAFLRTLPGPWVVKTDGLAAGKGVLVTDSFEEACADVRAKLSGQAFGEAGGRVVLEEALVGSECSLMVLTDGRRIAPLPVARDAKRLRDGDEGPNTGGMGAYAPLPDVDDRLVDRMLDEIVEPTLAVLRRRGIDYRGVLYGGLMLTAEGPKVLEFNVRLGDPEAEAVLPLVDEDLTALFAEAASGRLRTEVRSLQASCVCVVGASAGYPERVRTGERVEGLEDALGIEGTLLFAGGLGVDDATGMPVTTGGRVLAVCGIAAELEGAARRAYDALGKVSWRGMQYRRDVAFVAPGVVRV